MADAWKAAGSVLPKLKYDEVAAQAQRIFDMRGRPPYTPATFGFVSPDEARVLSDFVTSWMPVLVEKEKVK